MASRFLKIAGMAATIGAVGAVLLAERARPLRRQTRAVLPRAVRGAVMGASCQAVIMLTEAPATQAIARRNVQQGRGLVGLLGGGVLGKAAAFLAMDYGFYLWHIATHKVPFLWRFHRVHHVDPDLDAYTALRFHFADMLVSLPWRLVQVRVSGTGPVMLKNWQIFFLLSVLFHHSNTALPAGWDKKLARVITTPQMHGIHHSQNLAQMDSNWSSGISWWDHLHGTFRADVEQSDITIGVDDPLARRDIALLPALAAPLRVSGHRNAG